LPGTKNEKGVEKWEREGLNAVWKSSNAWRIACTAQHVVKIYGKGKKRHEGKGELAGGSCKKLNPVCNRRRKQTAITKWVKGKGPKKSMGSPLFDLPDEEFTDN